MQTTSALSRLEGISRLTKDDGRCVRKFVAHSCWQWYLEDLNWGSYRGCQSNCGKHMDISQLYIIVYGQLVAKIGPVLLGM